MTSGRRIDRPTRERIWRMAANNCTDLRVIAGQTDLAWHTVREVIFDGCRELIERIDAERRAAELDELADPHE